MAKKFAGGGLCGGRRTVPHKIGLEPHHPNECSGAGVHPGDAALQHDGYVLRGPDGGRCPSGGGVPGDVGVHGAHGHQHHAGQRGLHPHRPGPGRRRHRAGQDLLQPVRLGVRRVWPGLCPAVFCVLRPAAGLFGGQRGYARLRPALSAGSGGRCADHPAQPQPGQRDPWRRRREAGDGRRAGVHRHQHRAGPHLHQRTGSGRGRRGGGHSVGQSGGNGLFPFL